MSLLQTFTSLLGQNSSSNAQPGSEQHASVVQALMQHAGQQPGGLAGILDQFRQNGMGQHADSWLATKPGAQPAQSLEPQQVEQGLGTEGLQSIAQRAGISPEVAKVALATALPLLMSHLAQGSGQLPAAANSGLGLAGLAEGLLSRAL